MKQNQCIIIRLCVQSGDDKVNCNRTRQPTLTASPVGCFISPQSHLQTSQTSLFFSPNLLAGTLLLLLRAGAFHTPEQQCRNKCFHFKLIGFAFIPSGFFACVTGKSFILSPENNCCVRGKACLMCVARNRVSGTRPHSSLEK